MAHVTEIEGIGEVYTKQLEAVGIKTTEGLLKKGASPKGRAELTETTGISHKRILKWVNRADLFRVKGVGEQYSDLLAAAGVETVVELAQRRADHLHEAIVKTNKKKKLVREVPTEQHVSDWIEQAKSLKRVVTY